MPRSTTTKKRVSQRSAKPIQTKQSRQPRWTMSGYLMADRTWRVMKSPFMWFWKRNRYFMSRRPHRSFRQSRKRDMPYVAPLPSNIFFTSEVIGVVRRNWRSYLIFLLVYTALFTVLTGIINQENYSSFVDTVKSAGADIIGGDIGKSGEVFAAFGAVVTGQLSTSLTSTQQIYITTLSLLTWMSIVWFLRHRIQGSKVTVRDALYNSGAPILPTIIVVLVGMVQLVPGAIATILYFTAMSLDIFTGGVEAMVFAVAALLLVVLSLYWVTGTLFALIVVTLPGTYPFRALSMAGDVVIGRRTSMLIRLLWLVFMIALIWIFILVPAILLADALPWKWLPIVPFVAQLLAGFSILFAATYVYLLYRRMIDDPKKSA